VIYIKNIDFGHFAGTCLDGFTLFGHGNTRTLGQKFDGLPEIDLENVLNELDHVPADAATETFKNLPVRADIETRRFFVMERAQAGKVFSASFERNIFADNVNDVIGGLNRLNYLKIVVSVQKFRVPSKSAERQNTT
jgi:hypothetical protein